MRPVLLLAFRDVSALYAFAFSAAGRRVLTFLEHNTLQNTAKGLSVPDFSTALRKTEDMRQEAGADGSRQ
jgi:hypothetical protein